ncbi:MAG TPA: AbrB/MazE/SpoVT family DNA-binding domain-containing protein [Ktedonobacterales bacterium]|nr:AbrB/MazE/SpoVT family DNA-binding domain-containing protein [Ktedonobacterales bacterium]
MVIQRVRRVGNSFVVTIPKEEMERQGLAEGDEIALEVRKVVVRPQMSPEARAAFERSLETYAADYEYLKDR